MIFTTASKSVYEVNQTDRRIRRLSGVKDPTPRMGKDGEWRSYESMTNPEIGKGVIIMWSPEDTPPLPDTSLEEGGTILPTTITSVVEDILYTRTGGEVS